MTQTGPAMHLTHYEITGPGQNLLGKYLTVELGNSTFHIQYQNPNNIHINVWFAIQAYTQGTTIPKEWYDENI